MATPAQRRQQRRIRELQRQIAALRRPNQDPLQPMNRRQMSSVLDAYVNQSLAGPRAEFARQRESAINVAKAIAELQQEAGARTNAAFQGAAGTVGNLAQGYTGQMRADAEADAARTAETLRRAGAPQAQIDQVSGVGRGAADAAFALGGAIPSGDLAQQGANYAAALELMPPAELERGRLSALDIGRQALEMERTEGPKLRAEYQNQLIAQELSKAEQALQRRAQSLLEKQFGLDVVKTGADIAGDKAKLAQQNRQWQAKYELELAKHRAAVNRAAREGRRPNATLSAKYGYIVDSEGQPIKDARGRNIPVARTPGKDAGKSPWQQNRSAAIETARELYGKPVENPNYGKPIPGGNFKYLRPNGKGTNNPREARRDRDLSYRDAVDALVRQYGISRTNARRALAAAGWKPAAPKRGNQKVNPKPGTPGANRPG